MTEQAVAVATPDGLSPTSQTNKLMTPAPSVALDAPSCFLQLPAELRFLVYSYLSPYSSTDRKHFGKTQHLDLIQTCRRIREEAPPEIHKAAEGFYRDYEKNWYEKYSESIHIKKELSWDCVSVERGHFLRNHDVPLHELPFRQVDVCVPTTRMFNLQVDILNDFSRQVLESRPKVRSSWVCLIIGGKWFSKDSLI